MKKLMLLNVAIMMPFGMASCSPNTTRYNERKHRNYK